MHFEINLVFRFVSLAWDQSDKFVKVYLTDLKNVQSLAKDDFEFSAESSSVHFVAKSLNGRNCIFDIKELAYKINPEKSEYRVKTGKLKTYFFKHLTCLKSQSQFDDIFDYFSIY